MDPREPSLPEAPEVALLDGAEPSLAGIEADLATVRGICSDRSRPLAVS